MGDLVSGEDRPRSGVALATGFRFTPDKKALQIQVLSAETKAGSTESETNFADAFQGWFVVAPPPVQEVDSAGALKGATEFRTSEIGDALTTHASRDVRVAKYGQDCKAGEFALINAKGYRLFVGSDSVALTAGGGFLNFDTKAKKVGLAGVPNKPGGIAPYLSIDTVGIGMVSASGEASFSASGGQATVTGKTISVNGARVNLGVGASDPVVTYSQLMAVVAQLVTIFNTHFHGALGAGGFPTPPLVLVLVPGRSVFATAF